MYRFDGSAEFKRALTGTIFTGGFRAQAYRIRFGRFLGTVVGRLLLRERR